MNRSLAAFALVSALLPPINAAAQEQPGSFKVPGTDTTLSLHLTAQVYGTSDISGRIGDIENYDWASIPAVQPLDHTDAAKQTGQIYMTARTTRIGLTTSTPVSTLEVGSRIEADFNGPNGFQGQTYTNSVLLRLRHAYVTVGSGPHSLLVGQSWTQFLDFPSAPDTVDFNGPGSLALVRQTQVRYTYSVNKTTTIGVAAEAPHNFNNGYIPDITAKANTTFGAASLGLGLVTNQYRYTNTGDVTNKRSKQGFGGALSGAYKIGKDTALAHVVAGQGLGRYLFNSFANISGRTASGDFRLWSATAYHVGYTHVWTDKVRSNAVWSQTFFAKNGISEATFPGADDAGTVTFVPNKRIDQLFINSFYSFTKGGEVGLEYELARRHTFLDQTGKEDRITAVVTYSPF